MLTNDVVSFEQPGLGLFLNTLLLKQSTYSSIFFLYFIVCLIKVHFM